MGLRGLQGRAVLLTGAAGGIGRAAALRLAEEGCRLGLLDRDAAGLAALEAALREAGARACSAVCDLTRPDDVEEAVARCEAELGALEGLVNNAGWDRAAPFLETDASLWRQVVEINLMGPST